MDYRKESPEILKEFLTYHESIKSHSGNTVDEYYLDLRAFFRFLKRLKGFAPDNVPLDEISITDVDLDFVRNVRLKEVYDYLDYLSKDRAKNPNSPYSKKGLSAAARARKVATIRSFYKYLTTKAKLLETNPVADLDAPKVPKTLPRYLTLEESRRLLEAVDGKHARRDYCILCLFLNCGLRISEIVGLDLNDVRPDHLRIMGKGAKERVVYLNDACVAALNDYLSDRKLMKPKDPRALFLSNRLTRLSRETVHSMVKNTLLKAGLDSGRYSAHKLRHTAATLMLQNGVDVRTLQELLGHEHLNTTQIYTHVDNSELRIAARANPLGSFTPEEK